jgi:hypothetical protein
MAGIAMGPDGRLVRSGVELEMNPFCRRAVSKGVELAHECSLSRSNVMRIDTLRDCDSPLPDSVMLQGATVLLNIRGRNE